MRTLSILVGGLLLLSPALPAAAVTCSFDGGAHRVTIELSGSSTVSRGGGGEIVVDGTACGMATTSNTDVIAVSGTAGAGDALVIDMSGGPFEPGATPESRSTSEIEFEVTLEGDGGDRVVINGSANDDTFVAGDGGVLLNADPDVDVTFTGVGGLGLQGQSGNDILVGIGGQGARGATPVALQILGGEGNDVLTGGTSDDRLEGGPGDDTLDGDSGSDHIDGQEGRDTVTYAASPFKARVKLWAGEATGWGTDALLHLENVVGSPLGDRIEGDDRENHILGGAGRDRITGVGGNDMLVGGNGKDFFKAGPGDDTVIGGLGVDTYTLRSSRVPVKINLKKHVALGQGTDLVLECENAVGGRSHDRVTGTGGRNHRLVGGKGKDVIRGLGGPDRIRGGKGDDVLIGGAGEDELRGTGGDDKLFGGPGRDLCLQGDGEGPTKSCP